MGLYNGFGLNDDVEHNRSSSSNGSNQDVINYDIVHRKSSSMDSQMIAEHNRIASMFSIFNLFQFQFLIIFNFFLLIFNL